MTNDAHDTTPERFDLLQALAKQRRFLLHTVTGLSDEEAARRTTVSELCLGGIVKHVARVEQRWADFIVDGPQAMDSASPAAMQAHAASFRMLEGETLAGLVAAYEDATRRTDELVVSVDSLDTSHPLPDAPWFPAGALWSTRQVILHIVGETAQHAGHADIIRESLDGAKTMG